MDPLQIRHRLFEILETGHDEDRASRTFDLALAVLILVNVVAVALGTVASIQSRWSTELGAFEFISVVVFSLEYVSRVWVSVEDPRYSRPIVGRLRYMASWPAVVDLVAVLPFYLPVSRVDLRFVRLLRLFRLLRVLKLGRYSYSMQALTEVIYAQRAELWSSLTILVILLFSAGGLMYFVEHPQQPDVYADIPTALWLSFSTFSGNAIVTPVTVAGRVISAVISVLSAGLFALPAAILASGFSERIRRQVAEEAALALVADDDDGDPSADRG